MHSHDRTLLAGLGFADPDKREERHDYAVQYLSQPEVAQRLAQSITSKARHFVPPAVTDIHPEVHIAKGVGQYRSTIGFADLIYDTMVFAEDEVLDSYDYYMENLPRKRTEIKSKQFLQWLKEASVEEREQRWPGYKARVEEKVAPMPLTTRTTASGLVLESPEINHHDSFWGRSIAQELWECEVEVEFVKFATWAHSRKGQRPHLEFTDGRWIERESAFEAHGDRTRIVLEIKIQPIPCGQIVRQMRLYGSYLEARQWAVLTAFDISRADAAMLRTVGLHHYKLGASFEEFCARQGTAESAAPSPEI
jgi:hypothetical protein